jgi:hypothetical protein
MGLLASPGPLTECPLGLSKAGPSAVSVMLGL